MHQFPHWVQMGWRQVVNRLPEDMPLPILSGPLRGKIWHLSHHAYYPVEDVSGNGSGVQDYGYVSGRYERHTQKAICQYVRHGDVFWDLGAHHGFFSFLARDRGATTVVAFEGDPLSVARIRRNCPTAVIHAQFVGAETDWGQFPKPDVMKCDIDGGESEALLGLFTRTLIRPRVVILSTHGPIHDMLCRGLLTEHGYALETIPDDVIVAQRA